MDHNDLKGHATFGDTRAIIKARRAERRRAFAAKLRDDAPLFAAITVRETPLSVIITTQDSDDANAVARMASRAADKPPIRTSDETTKTITLTVRF